MNSFSPTRGGAEVKRCGSIGEKSFKSPEGRSPDVWMLLRMVLVMGSREKKIPLAAMEGTLSSTHGEGSPRSSRNGGGLRKNSTFKTRCEGGWKASTTWTLNLVGDRLRESTLDLLTNRGQKHFFSRHEMICGTWGNEGQR